MQIDHKTGSEDLGFGDLLLMLWNGRLLIAAVTAATILLGSVAYFLVPRIFESRVSVFPLRQAQFAEYLGLMQEDGAFPYTSVALHTEFSSYLSDFDRLMALAAETGVVERGSMSEEEYNLNVRRFVSRIRFESPDAMEIERGQYFLNIESRANDKIKLTDFMRRALLDANADMARDLAEEVRRRASEIKDQLDAQTTRLRVEIHARQLRVEDERNDEIVQLGEQSAIARSLGLEKPLDLRVIEAVEQGGTASAQINTGGNGQPYLQGYAALDKRIETLKNREDVDPFIPDLRQLQQQVYILENDPRPGRILTLLERSPLANSETAMVARFSLATANAEIVFPRLSVFGAASLFVGLLAGSVTVLLHRGTRRSLASVDKG